MQNQRNSQKKTSRKKCIIAAVSIILLCVIAGLTYRASTWTRVDSESKKASEAIIRQAAAKQISKDPNNLTDEDFAKIIKGLIKTDGFKKIKEDYIELFLIKPKILSPEEAKKLRNEIEVPRSFKQ